MLYASTRGGCATVTSAQAILAGIAPDGGLFVPTHEDCLGEAEINSLLKMSYQQRAAFILKRFLADFSAEEIAACVEQAYHVPKFASPAIAPLKVISERLAVLELWHGPTSAFKDMALQMLPRLLVTSARKEGDGSDYAILVATSGDTGKAALEGFKDVTKTRILVFYPKHGVSEIQRLQMVTQEGSNVGVVAVEGNFDDTQNGVKTIFNDQEFKLQLSQASFKLSSANSINWGRLVPQVVYYFSAYADLVTTGKIRLGDQINFVVPTGNFGNILAGYYAKTLGLPVRKLICASNRNNVLTDFIQTGVYDRNRPFNKTISPSMDILISSNLERLLYHLSDRDAVRVSSWMRALQEEGKYQVDRETKEKVQELFWSDFCQDNETMDTIKQVYQSYGYVLDPHTAVAWNVYQKYVQVTGDQTLSVIVSTASPFKFNASVVQAILGAAALEGKTEFELLDLLASETGLVVPEGLNNLAEKEVRHTKSCARDEMLGAVREFLGL
ncbi:threonine synthase [Zhaonella formicivorans]|uniref:threonine synthase n=1 Tax=Zhaonella formicivorans TaxID=2528593 RepID=UPI0010E2ECDC|nr:threonine synthase [Zhaonella formicivorans]